MKWPDFLCATGLGAAIIVAAMLAGGCGTTPKQRWAQQREALTAVTNTASELHDQGVIDDSEFRELYSWIRVARGAIKTAREQLPDGGTGFDQALERARATLNNVRLYVVDQQDEGSE